MLFFFTKKLLIQCKTFEENKKICSILSNNNIEYKSITKGISVFQRLGRIFWFNIYVNKKHFEEAKILISQFSLL